VRGTPTMIVEKPMWLRHAGLQIFSLDVQPSGLRFATAGGDHKVSPSKSFVFFFRLFTLPPHACTLLFPILSQILTYLLTHSKKYVNCKYLSISPTGGELFGVHVLCSDCLIPISSLFYLAKVWKENGVVGNAVGGAFSSAFSVP
jgi:hypothetical protein